MKKLFHAASTDDINLDILKILKKGCWSNGRAFYEHRKIKIIIYKVDDFNRIIEQKLV